MEKALLDVIRRFVYWMKSLLYVSPESKGPWCLTMALLLPPSPSEKGKSAVNKSATKKFKPEHSPAALSIPVLSWKEKSLGGGINSTAQGTVPKCCSFTMQGWLCDLALSLQECSRWQQGPQTHLGGICDLRMTVPSSKGTDPQCSIIDPIGKQPREDLKENCLGLSDSKLLL